jgi:hypothetical protein
MAILRAGPWGNFTESFNDVPSDTSVGLSISPVNCAKSDWPNQDWGARYEEYTGPDTDQVYGVASLGQDVVVTSNVWGTCQVVFEFCYQATQEFDVNFTWEFTGVTIGNFPDIGWTIFPMGEPFDSYFDTPADSGIKTITLPPSTFCRVSAFITGYGPGEGLIVTASLS